MTQETEMPKALVICGVSEFGRLSETTTEYIRRAVSKEEAGELAEYLDCGVACPPKIFDIIRKMAEAHK